MATLVAIRSQTPSKSVATPPQLEEGAGLSFINEEDRSQRAFIVKFFRIHEARPSLAASGCPRNASSRGFSRPRR
jgi:hypothetical protein